MELEKSLGEAQDRERARDELEKAQVEHLLSLADATGSKYLGCLPTFSCVDFWCLISVVFFGAETYGGAPPEGTSSANVSLAEAVGFVDRVCAYVVISVKSSYGARPGSNLINVNSKVSCNDPQHPSKHQSNNVSMEVLRSDAPTLHK